MTSLETEGKGNCTAPALIGCSAVDGHLKRSMIPKRQSHVALVMTIFTVAAAPAFHRNFSDQNQMIHFLKNISIVGGLIQAFAFGPGAFGFDGRRTTPVAAQ